MLVKTFAASDLGLDVNHTNSTIWEIVGEVYGVGSDIIDVYFELLPHWTEVFRFVP